MHTEHRSAPEETPSPADVRWAELMARAQDGDAVAYHRLLTEVAPYLRRIIARQLREPADIEDALQDTLLSVHQVRATYDPSRPFKPWLLAIARRRVVDRQRRASRIATNETSFDAESETNSPVAANASQEEMLTRDVQAALDRLPEGQRRAFLALKVRDLSLKEAAMETGMTVGALKVAVHRAIRALRRKLDPGSGSQ